jgi:hypothetical protein
MFLSVLFFQHIQSVKYPDRTQPSFNINMLAKAIVHYAPVDGEMVYKIQDVEVSDPGDNELLVEMIATGICHTDIFFASVPEGPRAKYPKIFGHEGKSFLKLLCTPRTY